MPVCTTTTGAAPAVAEAEAEAVAVAVELGGAEEEALGDGLVAVAVGVGLAVVVDLLLHAERRAIVAARATRPNRCMFMGSPHRLPAARLGQGSEESQICLSYPEGLRRGHWQREMPDWGLPEPRSGQMAK
jgi:hypothetical protein